MTAAYYRRKAERSLRRSEAAATEAERMHLRDEAEQWRRMAEQAEAQEADRSDAQGERGPR